MEKSARFVAITGGIGAGKSHVCARLKQLYGIEVYDSDAAAKRLMAGSTPLQQALIALVGPEVYVGGQLQKPVLARYILDSEQNKQAVNNIVHPFVANDFIASGHTWLESAILFDSGFYKRITFSKIIVVTAPLDVRISRVMARDAISRETVMEWMSRQWSQERLRTMAHCEIVNDGVRNIDEQIEQIVEQL